MATIKLTIIPAKKLKTVFIKLES